MKILNRILTAICILTMMANSWAVEGAPAKKITVAAASDLKSAMDDIVAAFRAIHPDAAVEVAYGSSGKFRTQIENGAPFDLFFSADIEFPRALAKAGLASSDVTPYAIGRIVLWSATVNASKLSLKDLAKPEFDRIAIANPQHAPYGKRAEEALRASGIWDQLQPRLVLGENIAQTAQFVDTGNAKIGIIALSLAMSPELAAKGGYALIPENLHQPLEQAFVITRHADGNALARTFADYVASPPARAIMRRYGFVLPGEASGR